MTVRSTLLASATTMPGALDGFGASLQGSPKPGLLRLFANIQSNGIAKAKALTRVDLLRRFSNIAPMMVGFGFAVPLQTTPWMVQIQRPELLPAATSRKLNWDDRQFCGGAVIAPGWVVTAAHCLTEYGSDIKTARYRLRLGMSDIGDPRNGVTYAITAIYPHPDYDHETYSNDIALVQFKADRQTGATDRYPVQPIELDGSPASRRRFGGRVAFVFGWGLTERESPSARLLAGSINLEADSACNNSSLAVCGKGAGYRGATQCHGDSGGPLVLFDGEKPVLIGVVSHNMGKAQCGTNPRPGVYTRIAGFHSWIERHIGRFPNLSKQSRATRTTVRHH